VLGERHWSGQGRAGGGALLQADGGPGSDPCSIRLLRGRLASEVVVIHEGFTTEGVMAE
jgi:hypothetical protein